MSTKSHEGGEGMRLGLGNSEMADDGWVLIAPFGEHPLTRRVLGADGTPALEHYLQVLDQAAADELMSRENSLFRRLKRAWVGLPVYREHPDLAEREPSVLTNQSARKDAVGVLDKLRKSDRGIEAHITLLPDKTGVVEKEGCKYPSVLWNTLPIGKRGDITLVKPYQLLSVGLTATPNIAGVEALANAVPTPDLPLDTQPSTPQQKTESDNAMKDKLIGWLIGQGIALANDASDLVILEAIQKKVTEVNTQASGKAAEATALANAKTELETRAGTLTTQLGTAQTALADLRKSAAGFATDLAIQKGIIPVADRDAAVAVLANSSDLDTEAAKLLARQATIKIGRESNAAADAGNRVALDNSAMQDPRSILLGLVNRKMAETKSNDFQKSWAEVARENPALLNQLNATATSFDKRAA